LSHPQKDEIDRAIAANEPNQRIATKYGVTESAVRRYIGSHFPEHVARAKELQDQGKADKLLDQFKDSLERVNKLFDACDAWLTDPDDPSRYDLSPRAENITVNYERRESDDSVTRGKATLQELLETVEGGGLKVTHVSTKQADPRELILKAVDRLHAEREFLAKVQGVLAEQQAQQANLMTNPQFQAVVEVIMRVLDGHPDLKAEIVDGMRRVGPGSG
jgi:regulator of protease activity HflC (stomatin/prohibitin superfamily)